MISNKTITIISKTLADIKFNDYCGKLGELVSDALEEAFEGERISVERKQRIYDRFVDK